MSDGFRCMWMRGGTSKGAFFLEEDLPPDPSERNDVLLKIMGSPDKRQIDGMGGGDPLTSKVAIVSPSDRDDCDVQYLFLQVFVDEAIVSDAQNCGNMLAGVGPFALERGLIKSHGDVTSISIFMRNTEQIAVATVQTPGGVVRYDGDARIDGVPGSHAPIPLEFRDTAGSSCGALLPTGNIVDVVEGTEVTLIDNGMPCIVLKAEALGISGYESREALDGNTELKERLEKIRLKAGPLMNLGDVTEKSIPKLMLVAPPMNGGAITVRSFIPHRAHASIGVLGAVTVATAAILPGSVAHSVALVAAGDTLSLSVEHPTGELTCIVKLDSEGQVKSASLLRTARKLFDGTVFA